jgi:hypothetical protein
VDVKTGDAAVYRVIGTIGASAGLSPAGAPYRLRKTALSKSTVPQMSIYDVQDQLTWHHCPL